MSRAQDSPPLPYANCDGSGEIRGGWLCGGCVACYPPERPAPTARPLTDAEEAAQRARIEATDPWRAADLCKRAETEALIDLECAADALEDYTHRASINRLVVSTRAMLDARKQQDEAGGGQP